MSDEDSAPFRGRVGRTWQESVPWSPAGPVAPPGSPNVVFVVLDDVGFSDLGCFGAEIATPRIDALAAAGLRYNNFHVTAMCSPTRACLLTGRNAHAVGVGAIAEWSTGFPGYRGRISRRAATAAEILAEHAYGTYAIGKWHLSNLANYAAAGPHEHWPLGRGFARWYGFLGGYVDHWNPDLHEDNHPVCPVRGAGYHLSEDLVDHAIAQVRDHVTTAGGRPFFLYLAFGAGHWPLHVPAAYIERQAGRYDCGWDEIRRARLARQLALGIVPAGTALTPRNPGVRAWAELPADERRLAARLQETYAAFLEHADAQLGRLVDYLSAIGRLDDTLLVLLSDNGASGEGGPTGAVSIRKHMLTEKESVEYGIANLERIGSEHSFPHYPFGWAQVSNTPLKWYKKNTHGGGIRAPLVVHWPARIRDVGGVRNQYHHVIDVLPTVLEAAGAVAPSTYRGVAQLPIHGTSMVYSWDDAGAPTRKRTQHFEIVGDRAIWHEGWKAVARHQKGADFDADRWELYHLDEDFAETDDRAAEEPERVRALVDLWWDEARKHDVLPLDDRETERAQAWFRDAMPSRYEYQAGMARVDRLLIPAITDRSFLLRADLRTGMAGAEGVILACGNRFAGFVLHCGGHEAVFEYIYTEARRYTLRAPLPAGTCRLALRFDRAAPQHGRFSLWVNGHEHDAVEVERTWSTYAVTAGLTCGYANVPIAEACAPPARFTGVIERVIVEVARDRGDPGDAFAALLQEQ